MTVSETDRFSTDHLADIILQSLENEYILDGYIAKRYFTEDELRGMPSFKQLKLVPLKRRFGPVIVPLLNIAARLLPLRSVLEISAWLVLKFIMRRRRPPLGDCVYLAYFERDVSLINRVLREEALDVVGLYQKDIVQRLTLHDMLDGLKVIIAVHRKITKYPPDFRRDLSLQAWDLCGLTLVALHARRFVNVPIVTSSILQRWTFVIGHTAQKAWMVQHGFMPIDVSFTHPFSDVDRIYAYSEEQFQNYRTYYGTADWRLISSDIELSDVCGSRNALFLASSAPHVDEEIAILKALKPILSVPLAIKLHPRHVYDERAKILLEYADIVIPGKSNPDCRVFLSHSSFYGLMYQRHGIRSIAFSEQDSIEGLRGLLKAEGMIRSDG